MQRIKRPFYQPFLYWFCKTACAMAFKTIWRLRVVGSENVPKTGPIILGVNHRSLADPPLVGVSTARKVHFLAKEELFEFKPFGWLISNLNAHPLNRGGSDVGAFKTAKEVLGAGETLIVFPEGRRSKTDELGKPKAGVAMLAEMAQCPVVPTYVHNSGYLKDFKQLTVAFGMPLLRQDYPTREAMTEAIMGEICRLKTAVAEGKI